MLVCLVCYFAKCFFCSRLFSCNNEFVCSCLNVVVLFGVVVVFVVCMRCRFPRNTMCCLCAVACYFFHRCFFFLQHVCCYFVLFLFDCSVVL